MVSCSLKKQLNGIIQHIKVCKVQIIGGIYRINIVMRTIIVFKQIRKMVVPKLLSTCMRYSPVKHQSFTPNGSDRVFSLIIVSGSFILYECAHIQTCPLISHWFTIGSPMMITCQCNRTYQC